MRLLLDTHAFIWMDAQRAKLSQAASAAILDPHNKIFLSMASVWEIQIKSQLGRLELRQPLTELIQEQQEDNSLQLLPIELEHIAGLAALDHYHRDPFDRMIISSAKCANMQLVSNDSAFNDYPVTLLW